MKQSTLNFCIVCRGNNLKTIYAGLKYCIKCTHTFADLSLTKEDYKALYQKDYFHGAEYANYFEDKKIIQKNFQYNLEKLLSYLKNAKDFNLLEIGCAYGFFLELAKPYFKTVMGIDIFEEGVKYAADNFSIPTQCIDFLDFKPEKDINIYCLWDTIEHLPRPDLYIEKINNISNDNAFIALTTSDISSFVAKARKEHWRQIHPPTHVHYFSKQSITYLLNSRGFDIIHIEYIGSWRSSELILHRIMGHNFFKNMASLLLPKNIYLNLFDIMYILAKKTST